jgi:hypothetical protein
LGAEWSAECAVRCVYGELFALLYGLRLDLGPESGEKESYGAVVVAAAVMVAAHF